MYVIKGWENFQHYTDRSPPWIKLHKKFLDDYDFHSLPVASRALAPMLWLLASEHENPRAGFIEGPEKKIAFRLHLSITEFEDAVKPLIDSGFILPASTALALSKQDARPETENRDRGRDRTYGKFNKKGVSNAGKKSFSQAGQDLANEYLSTSTDLDNGQ